MASKFQLAGFDKQVFMVWYRPQVKLSYKISKNSKPVWHGRWFPLWKCSGYSPWDAAKKFRLGLPKQLRSCKLQLRIVTEQERKEYLKKRIYR